MGSLGETQRRGRVKPWSARGGKRGLVSRAVTAVTAGMVAVLALASAGLAWLAPSGEAVSLLATPVAGVEESGASAAAELTAATLEAGTLAEGEEALAAMVAANPDDDDARAGLGVVRLIQAVERVSQGLYTYGLRPPQSMMVPVLRLPVPENPDPQPITYEDFQKLIATFVDDLAEVEATLADVDSPDLKLVLDLTQIRYDIDGDGVAADNEVFMGVVERVSGMTAADMPASLTFAFDLGDVLWLRAYCHVLMGLGEFMLAHDWKASFDASFFHLFPAMESPFRDALKPATEDDMSGQIAPIADFISFIHIPWPVTEPERMAAVRTHLKQMVALSRESWRAIEAETDDVREWLPNAMQTSPFASVPVDAARIAAWFEVLDEVDLILDGKKLVPHWRFSQGINLYRVFEEPQAFDLVLWVTGPAALPYLEDGPISTSEEWARMTEAFQGSFLLFALWSN